MIPVTDIDAATHIIDTSGVVGLLGDAMRTDHRGRKDHPNKLRLLLIGMLLCIHEHGRATITVVHKLLTTELPVGVQFTLGVRRWKTDTDGQSIWILPIHDLYELSAKITNRLGYGDGKHPDLDPNHPLVAAPPPDHGFVMLTEEEYAHLAERYQTDAA